MSDLVHCIYVSAASRPMPPAELVTLLQSARAKNDTLGLTGMLLHIEGSFFQVLEGEPAKLGRLYRQILADRRHTAVTKLIEEPIEQRSFAEWTMGFTDVPARELSSLVGGNDFFGRAGCFDGLDAGRAKTLLERFREGGWRKRLS